MSYEKTPHPRNHDSGWGVRLAGESKNMDGPLEQAELVGDNAQDDENESGDRQPFGPATAE